MRFFYMAIILLVLSLAGCQTHPLESTPLDQVVVEAYLYENQPVDQIRLSHPFSISSPQGQNSPITEAQVFLSRNGMEYQLLPYPGEPGRYHAEDPALVVSSGDLFELKILYKEKIISAQTRVPSVPRIARISNDTLSVGSSKTTDGVPLEIVIELPDGQPADLFFVNIRNIEQFPVPLPDFLFLTTGPQPIWSQPFANLNYQLNLQGLTHQGRHQVKVTSMNREYAEFYAFQTQGDQSFTPIPSNIRNGLGIFTAFSVSAPTYIFVR